MFQKCSTWSTTNKCKKAQDLSFQLSLIYNASHPQQVLKQAIFHKSQINPIEKNKDGNRSGYLLSFISKLQEPEANSYARATIRAEFTIVITKLKSSYGTGLSFPNTRITRWRGFQDRKSKCMRSFHNDFCTNRFHLLNNLFCFCLRHSLFKNSRCFLN